LQALESILRFPWSMIPKEPAPGLTRGGSQFSEQIMLKQKAKL
jgi:hypothetical protein